MDKSKGLPESSPLDLFVAYNTTNVHQFSVLSFTQFLLCQTQFFYYLKSFIQSTIGTGSMVSSCDLGFRG